MVKVSFDTNGDTVEELEEAMQMLQSAIARRKGHQAEAPPKDEETTIDAGFLKITVKEEHKEPGPEEKVPTLNEMLDERLTEEDFSKMFKEQLPEKKAKEKKGDEPYIEIVEYGEEK
jgi:hypothetical protein